MGCGIGCGVFVLLGIALMLGGSFVMMRPFKRAVESREVLDTRFGDQANYTPAPDGAIPPDRLEVFLAVREDLMQKCGEFAAADRQFERMDELGEDAPKRVILEEFFSVTKVMFGMGSRMGGFFEIRNTALLEAGMGRAEYTYIYTMAYLDQLRPETRVEGIMGDARHPNARVQQILLQHLRNQLAELESLATAKSESVARQDLAADEYTVNQIRDAVQNEILLLENQPRRLPWQDGLPQAIAASLAPYRERLDELFCAHTVPFEYTQNRVRGLGIHGN
jgi:hypothetical protein